MAKTNKKAADYRVDLEAPRLAGGMGPRPAVQDAEKLLRRAVMACLLWEDLHYQTGAQVAENIAKLVPYVDPYVCSLIAIEARNQQKLRHVPLFIAREMARYPKHKALLGELLPQIIKRADELTEFLAIYWKNGKCPLAKQVKLGLGAAFLNFNEYHFGKYDGKEDKIKPRDVMFMAHPVKGLGKNTKEDRKNGIFDKSKTGILFKKLVDGNLEIPDTWEVALATGKDKKETWTRLINEKKLGGLAFLRNLRNMKDAGVPYETIRLGFDTVNSYWLLPLNYLAAAKEAPEWEREIETMMLKQLGAVQKLPGYTIMVIDVSGSMHSKISDKSDFNRMQVAAVMAMLAAETCEHISLYTTAGNDGTRKHQTKLMRPHRGFSFIEQVEEISKELGGGGIFTRQCLEYIKANDTNKKPDRIIVFSDSQDCDTEGSKIPAPFGVKNYVVDVSSYDRGVAYDGIWTAEVSGWSEHFVNYIRSLEGVEVVGQSDEAQQ